MPNRRDAEQEGRVLLRKLLPEARRRAAEDPDTLHKQTAVARAQMRYVTEDNLDAVLIYRAEYGGWICDVTLKRVPAGIASSFGTAVRSPWPTREAAEASAVRLLAFGLSAAALIAGEPPAPRVFDYFGHEITLGEDILRFMEDMVEGAPDLRLGSPDAARAKLDAVTEQLLPGGVTTEALTALTRGQKAELLTALSFAALEGMFRYPEWRAEPVGRHRPDRAP